MENKENSNKKITFEELGLSEPTLKALKKKGFEHPTPIQALTIPALLKGDRDIIGQAQTGTGKTAAFALPLIEMLKENANGVQALVLAPTRELAIQVAAEIDSLKGDKKLNVLPVYGGQAITVQLSRLRKQVDIVVGTPGRVTDHLKRKTLKINNLTHVVLDEADEMLNMGFLTDVIEILEYTPKEKQVLLFSATMAPEILKIAKKHMGDYDILKVAQQVTCDNVEQIYYELSPRQRFNALCRVIDHEDPFYGLVFCRTKMDTERVARKLSEFGYQADALNGDMSQSAREKILTKFKKRQITILVATDVAARGIDVQDVSHVVNFALPQEPEAYVHRIGRTGRAGKKGKAISFAGGSDRKKLVLIERKIKAKIEKSPLPTPEDIIASKKKSIITQIQTSLEKSPQEYYVKIADEILEGKEATHVIATLLKRAFKNKLDPKRYVIEEEKPGDRSRRERERGDFSRPRRSSSRGGERRSNGDRPRRSGGRSGGSRSGGFGGRSSRDSERSGGFSRRRSR